MRRPLTLGHNPSFLTFTFAQLRLRADKLPSPNHCARRDFLLVFKNLSLSDAKGEMCHCALTDCVCEAAHVLAHVADGMLHALGSASGRGELYCYAYVIAQNAQIGHVM